MRGRYKISSPGNDLMVSNVITNAGKTSVLNAVAGKSVGFASSIIAGIGNTAATENDTELVYAVGGNDINSIIVDPVNAIIYFKATLPAADNYKIYELGCFGINYTGAQNNFGAGNISLVVFGGASGWEDAVGTSALASTNNRLGISSLQYTSFTSAKGSMPMIQNFDNLPDTTTFDLAYYVNAVSSVDVRFKFDDDNYFESSTWAVSNGYHIDKIQKGDFTSTGSPSWGDIKILEVEAAGTSATISLDALRYTVPVVSEAIESSLVSRVVLDIPQQKLAGVSMDIEYALELDI